MEIMKSTDRLLGLSVYLFVYCIYTLYIDACVCVCVRVMFSVCVCACVRVCSAHAYVCISKYGP